MSWLENKKFTNALYISTFLHVVAIIVFYFGVPSFREKFPDEQEVYTFEMLPASAITNVKTQSQQKKGRVEKNAKEIKQSKPTANTEPVGKKESEKPKEKKIEKEDKPKEKRVVVDAPAKKTPKNPKQNQTKKQDTSKASTSKPKPKVKKKPQQDPMDTLLKNLESASVGETSESQFRAVNVNELDDGKFSKGPMYDENSPLSITEKLIIKKQIESNWQPPIGLENLEDMRILLYMKLNEDGSVSSLDIKNIVCPAATIATCKIFAESVVRAIKKANPLENLSPNRYDIWKEFELNFDPSQIAQ